jgi:hypothetical protein
MPDSATLCHTKWDCKYRVVFIPKYRRKALYHALRRYLGEVFRALASEPQVAQRPAERAQFSAIVTGTGGLWRQPHGQRYVFLHHVRDEVGGAVCEYVILRGTDALKVADLPPDSVFTFEAQLIVGPPVANGQFVAVRYGSLRAWLCQAPLTQDVICIGYQKAYPL